MTVSHAGKDDDRGAASLPPTGLEPQRAGALEVRLATTPADIDAAQALRYRVFYEEMTAKPTAEMAARKRDFDSFDPYCDHLIVIDHKRGPGPKSVVATYRLLRRAAAAKHGGFYTASEFDIAPLLRYPGEILELGRSCVLKSHRTKPVLELLWQGIWDFVRALGIDVMFGCASLEGAEGGRHAETLGLLAGLRETPAEWRAAALPGERRIEMSASAGLDRRRALHALPPLIKGYLRLGCYIGDGAVIDRQFDTVDVLIILPVAAIDRKYFGRFGGPTG